MKILTVNAGSSSLKFNMIKLPEKEELISGNFEKIGLAGGIYSIKINGSKIKKEADMRDHKDAIELLIKELFDNDIIKYIQGTHMDFTTLYRLNNLEIVPIDNIGINTNSIELGYYSLGNKLYIYDYDEEKLNEYFLDIVPYKGFVGHEYSHLLMANFDYRFLNEGIASIITDEYFAPINSSYTELKISTKKELA